MGLQPFRLEAIIHKGIFPEKGQEEMDPAEKNR
jgi:hypothetical protein